MNKSKARKIAEVITNKQLKEMFDNAKANIKDWTKISSVNKGMTKGTSWNILAKNFDPNTQYHILAKTNMIWEFGDYLSIEFFEKEKKDHNDNIPVHQNPIFDFFNQHE